MLIDPVEVTTANTQAFTRAVSVPGALDLPVPTCPGWTVAHLVVHLGHVQSWWNAAIRAGGANPEPVDRSLPGSPGEVLGWWRQRSAEFLNTLHALPPDARCWCWWNAEQQDTVAAAAWRQAHEIVIHRWDAERALGEPNPIDPDVAEDGIDEFCARMLPADGWRGPVGTLRLSSSDTGRVWTFAQVHGRRLPFPEDTATGSITGTAEELDLLLWGRITLHDVAVSGDTELATAFLSWPNLGGNESINRT